MKVILRSRRVYWDACTFLGLLNQESVRSNDCTAVWKEAEKGETLIFTSFFGFAEVFKVKCEGKAEPLTDEYDKKIEQLLQQKWIRPVVVDEKISFAARQLMRGYKECKKPADGIHLATALALSVDEMHTFDKSDLLRRDGKIMRADSVPLTICTPRLRPRLPNDPNTQELFSE